MEDPSAVGADVVVFVSEADLHADSVNYFSTVWQDADGSSNRIDQNPDVSDDGSFESVLGRIDGFEPVVG